MLIPDCGKQALTKHGMKSVIFKEPQSLPRQFRDRKSFTLSPAKARSALECGDHSPLSNSWLCPNFLRELFIAQSGE
jgi:hypothetical protein